MFYPLRNRDEHHQCRYLHSHRLAAEVVFYVHVYRAIQSRQLRRQFGSDDQKYIAYGEEQNILILF